MCVPRLTLRRGLPKKPDPDEAAAEIAALEKAHVGGHVDRPTHKRCTPKWLSGRPVHLSGVQRRLYHAPLPARKGQMRGIAEFFPQVRLADYAPATELKVMLPHGGAP
jgi:hypothetical protein